MKKYSFFFLLVFLSLNVSASNYYWVGGTGNWSDYSNHWSTTSGGSVFHVQSPTPVDNVFFDVNSFVTANDSVYLDSTIVYCKDMNWTGATGNPVFINAPLNYYGTLKIYGSLTLSNNLIWSIGYTYFLSTITTNTITSNGVILNEGETYFSGIGGMWTLQDSLSTSGHIRIDANSTFKSNNKSIRCYNFRNYGNADLGTSYLKTLGGFTSTGLINADSSMIDADYINYIYGGVYNKIVANDQIGGTIGNATIDSLIINHSAGASCVMGNNAINYEEIFGSSSFQIDGSGNTTTRFISNSPTTIVGNNMFTRADFMNDASISSFGLWGSNVFDSLYFNNPGKIVQLGAGDTLIVNTILNTGSTCSSYTEIHSTISGQQSTISKSSGSVLIDYIVLKDLKAIGGAVFTANSSIDNGNVTGFTINTPIARNVYWVGGTGNWNDPNHWSLTSGGLGGNCPPIQLDNVFFDVNSFVTANDSVYLDSAIVYCKDMDWTGATGNPVFINAPLNYYGTLKIYGSLTLSNNLIWSIGYTYFLSTITTNTITSNGVILNEGETYFSGVGGMWTLQDSLSTSGHIRIDANSTFKSNNKSIRCYNFRNYGNTDLGTTYLIAYGSFTSTATAVIDADSSTLDVGYVGYINGSTYNKIIAQGGGTVGSVTIDSLIINNVSPSSWVMIGNTINYYELSGFSFFQMDGSGNTVTNFVANTPTTIVGNNIFTRADFMNDVSISSANDVGVWGGNVFDSLYFNNPSKIVQLGAGDTLVVNNDLQINGSGGFPVLLQSTSPGIQSTLSKSTDTVCTNFIYLQDIVGAGGAVFYAGINSFDLGNNIGWSFTSCQQPISNVWPGDANYDLVANNIDILNIGLAYNEMGFVRPGATITWQAEPCLDWFAQFIDTTNVKHADCDGNGIVDANDTMAVSLNYSLTHPAMAPNNNLHVSPFDLYIDIPTASLNQGDTVSVPVKLGTTVYPATNIYGIAFTVNYDQTLIENGDIYVTYDSSWLVSATNNVHLEKNFSSFGQLDVGFSRINHLNQSGSGTIATLHFIVSTTSIGNLILNLSNVQMIDNAGNIISTTVFPDSVNIITSTENNALVNEKSILYPNPSTNYFYFDYYTDVTDPASIIIYTIQGVEIKSINLQKTAKGKNHYKIDVSDIPAGLYLCTLKTGSERINKQLILTK